MSWSPGQDTTEEETAAPNKHGGLSETGCRETDEDEEPDPVQTEDLEHFWIEATIGQSMIIC